MKITKVERFDDEITDEDGSLLEAYRGYNILIDETIGARVYDHDPIVYISLDASQDPGSTRFDEVLRTMLDLGYDDVRFLSTNGYKTLEAIRRDAFLPLNCWGRPARTGGPCPQCGRRLFQKDTKQCECGWQKA
jgi:hypothetical protein